MQLGTLSLKPSELHALLVNAYQNKLKVLIVGYPGVGKTAIVEQAARQVNFDIQTHLLSIEDPTDRKGMPFAWNDNGVMRADFIPFHSNEMLITATRPTVGFFDEIGQATFANQAAFMQTLHGGRVGRHKVSEHVVFVGATNDPTMKSGVVGMIEPLKSRWDTIVHLRVDHEEWEQHAMDADMHPTVISCLKCFPHKLHPLTMGDEKEAERYKLSTKDLVNMPCPRTWEAVSRLEKAGVATFPVVAGAIGAGDATVYMAHRELVGLCPDPKDILAHPKTAIVPDNPSALWATTTALACHASEATSEAIITYGERIAASGVSRKAMEVRMHQLCQRRDKQFWLGAKCKKAKKWCMENTQYIVGFKAA